MHSSSLLNLPGFIIAILSSSRYLMYSLIFESVVVADDAGFHSLMIYAAARKLNFDGGSSPMGDVIFWRESGEIAAGQIHELPTTLRELVAAASTRLGGPGPTLGNLR